MNVWLGVITVGRVICRAGRSHKSRSLSLSRTFAIDRIPSLNSIGAQHWMWANTVSHDFDRRRDFRVRDLVSAHPPIKSGVFLLTLACPQLCVFLLTLTHFSTLASYEHGLSLSTSVCCHVVVLHEVVALYPALL